MCTSDEDALGYVDLGRRAALLEPGETWIVPVPIAGGVATAPPTKPRWTPIVITGGRDEAAVKLKTFLEPRS